MNAFFHSSETFLNSIHSFQFFPPSPILLQGLHYYSIYLCCFTAASFLDVILLIYYLFALYFILFLSLLFLKTRLPYKDYYPTIHRLIRTACEDAWERDDGHNYPRQLKKTSPPGPIRCREIGSEKRFSPNSVWGTSNLIGRDRCDSSITSD